MQLKVDSNVIEELIFQKLQIGQKLRKEEWNAKNLEFYRNKTWESVYLE